MPLKLLSRERAVYQGRSYRGPDGSGKCTAVGVNAAGVLRRL